MQSTADDNKPLESEGATAVWQLHIAEWLTAAEAAAYAGGVGISTIRSACNRNALRHVRVGGGATGPIRTRREWVTDWLQRWARGGDPI